MTFGRRLGSLVFGFGCSILMLLLLVLNCMERVDTPVIARLSMQLPYKLADCPLVLHDLTGYDGAYMEDGTDREVSDVAALLVENVGRTMLINSHIAVYTDTECFLFYADMLPPGEQIVLLERDVKKYLDQTILSCWASVKPQTSNNLTQLIYVQPIGMDTLELWNTTDKTIDDIYIYHKTWAEEIGAYLGGISYVTYVDKLEPGQRLFIKPEHYALGRSRVIWIRNAGHSQ